MPTAKPGMSALHLLGAFARTVDVVGESFDNADGSSRQEELARCAVGEPVAARAGRGAHQWRGCRGVALLVLIGSFSMAACEGDLVNDQGAIDANGADQSGPSPAPEFRAMPGLGNFAMIIPEGIAPEAIAASAKDRCGTDPICTVYGWTGPASAVRALPLTVREAEALAFQYSVNRTSGFERAQWDCARWPQEDSDACLTKGGE